MIRALRKSRSRKYLSTSENFLFWKRIKTEMLSSSSLHFHLTKIKFVSYCCTSFKYCKLTNLRHYRQVSVSHLNQTLSIETDNVDYTSYHSLELWQSWKDLEWCARMQQLSSFISVLMLYSWVMQRFRQCHDAEREERIDRHSCTLYCLVLSFCDSHAIDKFVIYVLSSIAQICSTWLIKAVHMMSEKWSAFERSYEQSRLWVALELHRWSWVHSWSKEERSRRKITELKERVEKSWINFAKM